MYLKKKHFLVIGLTIILTVNCSGKGTEQRDGDAELTEVYDTIDNLEVIDIEETGAEEVSAEISEPEIAGETFIDIIEEDLLQEEQNICHENAECSSDEFCEFSDGVCGGDGSCVPRGDGNCPGVYAPVCGCDNMTYGNDCLRRYARVSLLHAGECEVRQCRYHDPDDVCGDGEFCEGPGGVCDEITEGWCELIPPGCPDIYDPVCGCDGNTYANDCERKVAGVWLAFRGECSERICYQNDPTHVCSGTEFCEGPPGSCGADVPGWCAPVPSMCPDIFDPVCGCDGVTYGNDCERQMARVWLHSWGECSSGVTTCNSTSRTCPRGTFCEYPTGDCGVGPASEGVCTNVPLICPPLWAPVCGCDRNTYANDCVRQSSRVSKLHDGEC